MKESNAKLTVKQSKYLWSFNVRNGENKITFQSWLTSPLTLIQARAIIDQCLNYENDHNRQDILLDGLLAVAETTDIEIVYDLYQSIGIKEA